MNLADVEKLKDRRTGLVPMRVTRSFAPYFKNEVAGFPPKMALGHFKNGDATFHGKRAQVVVAAAPAIPKATSETPSVVYEGDIPSDWDSSERGNTLRRLSLASKISGTPAKDIGSDDNAKAIIRAEIDRRAKK